jgi:hypothetical protein
VIYILRLMGEGPGQDGGEAAAPDRAPGSALAAAPPEPGG